MKKLYRSRRAADGHHVRPMPAIRFPSRSRDTASASRRRAIATRCPASRSRRRAFPAPLSAASRASSRRAPTMTMSSPSRRRRRRPPPLPPFRRPRRSRRPPSPAPHRRQPRAAPRRRRLRPLRPRRQSASIRPPRPPRQRRPPPHRSAGPRRRRAGSGADHAARHLGHRRKQGQRPHRGMRAEPVRLCREDRREDPDQHEAVGFQMDRHGFTIPTAAAITTRRSR